MRNIKLILMFYKRSILASLTLFVLLTVTVYSLMEVVATYSHIIYTKNMFENSDLKNSAYFSSSAFDDAVMSDEEVDIELLVSDIRASLEEIPAVSATISTKGFSVISDDIYNFMICDSILIERIPLSLRSGDWTAENIGDAVPVVISNNAIAKNIGERFTVQGCEFIVTGVMGGSGYLPSFSTGSDSIYTDDILEKFPLIVIEDTEENRGKLENNFEYYSHFTSPHMLVLFDRDSTEQQRDTAIVEIEKQGYVNSYEEIIENTNIRIEQQIRSLLSTPVFLSIISLMSFLSVSVIFVMNKHKEYAVYYLAGSSKRRTIAITSVCIGFIGLLAYLVNLLYIAVYFYFAGMGRLMSTTVNYDNSILLFGVLYLILVVILAVFIPWLMLRKTSPLEIYRRMED